MTRTIEVAVPGHEYPIHIGRSLIGDPELLRSLVADRRVVVVTNETVAPLYLGTLTAALPDTSPLVVTLPDGEQYKTMAQCEAILDVMLENRLGRDALLIALGGGVVGDLAGFAAAIFQRGIDFIQVPTTLLAQIDSSVGGKTAVNHPRGKNLIGAFHQPIAVITDLDTLDTLPPREFHAGLAEVVKYGLLGDAEFFEWLEGHREALLSRDGACLSDAIARCCAHKARIVAADEKEAGLRALLNLGHTFGHAIEAHVRYQGWLHGEAVAVGLCMAADLSQRHGFIGAADSQRVSTLITAMNLPTQPPDDLHADTMLDLMKGDKKTAKGRIRLVLMRAIGQAELSADYDDALLMQTLEAYCRT